LKSSCTQLNPIKRIQG